MCHTPYRKIKIRSVPLPNWISSHIKHKTYLKVKSLVIQPFGKIANKLETKSPMMSGKQKVINYYKGLFDEVDNTSTHWKLKQKL